MKAFGIFCSLLLISWITIDGALCTVTEALEDYGSGMDDFNTTAVVDVTQTTVSEDHDPTMSTKQIVFITCVASFMSLLLIVIMFIYICTRKRVTQQCYSPLSNLAATDGNDDDETLYMVDYDEVAMNHGKLTITVNTDTNAK